MKRTETIMLGFLLLAAWVGAESIGVTVALEGKASATEPAGTPRALAIKSDILLNDTVKTEAKSRLQVSLNDNTLLAVGESSDMLIDEYVYNPAKASDNAFGVKMGKGLFRVVTDKITDLNPDRFTVKTRRATIGIRGCDLGFDTTAENEDRVAVLAIPKGKKVIITATATGKTLTVETPTFITISDRGLIFQRDLTSADRNIAQQVTAPLAGTPEPVGLIPPDVGPLTQPDVTPATDNSAVQNAAQHGYESQP